jgi:hypothetical protein
MIDLTELTEEQQNKLQSISRQDEEFLETLTDIQIMNIENSGLEPKAHSLCSLAALISVDAPIASYAWQTAVAEESGVTVDDVIGVLITLAPTVGMAHIVAAATKLSIVYDVEVEEIWKAA